MKRHHEFPILAQDIIYLDSGASSLKPTVVLDAMQEYYEEYGVNIHRGVYRMSYKATQMYEQARETMAKFIHAQPQEIVFTRGTSAGLNMVARMLEDAVIREGDEIIVSQLEHHSGLLPWQEVARRNNATLVFVPLTTEGRITTDAVASVITAKTKVIALTHASNVMGYITPIEEICRLAKERHIITTIDAAQSAPLGIVNVNELGCDFLSFGGHKMCGPTGIGVLYGRFELLNQMHPVEFGGEMNDGVSLYSSTYKDAPFKFETGTMPIAEAIGMAKAAEYVMAQSGILEDEQRLVSLAMSKLRQIKGVTVYNTNPEFGIVTFNIEGVHPHDTASYLDEYQIAVRAGHHCCQPLMQWLGVDSTVRATFYLYNDESDVDKLVEAVNGAAEFFGQFE
jgi:cysteine desulfurase / selenocysteine lyase